jgi:uncharacterized protein YfiM (DUF2279 family)
MKKRLPLFIALLGWNMLSAQPSPAHVNDTLPHINRRRLAAAIITESTLYIGGTAYLSQIWYKDVPRTPFTYYNDSKGYLQIDKCGHAFAAYWESYAGYKWLRSAGVSKKKALIYGGPLGLVLQTPIEILDGLYEGWGFSWSDMVANSVGSGLMIGQELIFDEQLFTFKFSFRRSIYARQAHGYLGETPLKSLFYDYNGHTYWLSAPIERLTGLQKLPPWLHIAAGYSANGMYGEFVNRTSWKGLPIPPSPRYRQFLLSLDIGWDRIPVRKKWLRYTLKAISFIKMPMPTLELNSMGKVRGHWYYF